MVRPPRAAAPPGDIVWCVVRVAGVDDLAGRWRTASVDADLALRRRAIDVLLARRRRRRRERRRLYAAVHVAAADRAARRSREEQRRERCEVIEPTLPLSAVVVVFGEDHGAMYWDLNLPWAVQAPAWLRRRGSRQGVRAACCLEAPRPTRCHSSRPLRMARASIHTSSVLQDVSVATNTGVIRAYDLVLWLVRDGDEGEAEEGVVRLRREQVGLALDRRRGRASRRASSTCRSWWRPRDDGHGLEGRLEAQRAHVAVGGGPTPSRR